MEDTREDDAEVEVPEGPFSRQRRLIGDIENPIVFDLGANVGQTAATYRGVFEEPTIHCFEPATDLADKARARHVEHPEVHVHTLAISDATGYQTLHVSSAPCTNSLFPKDPEAPRQWRMIDEVEVPSMTLDTFCDRHKIDHIDILKMDIQGGEVRALEGAHDMLRRSGIALIYTEIMFTKVYIGGAEFWEIFDVLADHGYRLHSIYPTAVYGDGQWDWADAIIISPELQATQRRLRERR